MSLFCGKTCKCKKNCKGWFPTYKDARKGCEKACKGGSPPTSRTDYLDRFAGPEVALRDFGVISDPDGEFDACSLPEHMYRPECLPQEESNGSMSFIIIGIIAVLAIIFLTRKK